MEIIYLPSHVNAYTLAAGVSYEKKIRVLCVFNRNIFRMWPDGYTERLVTYRDEPVDMVIIDWRTSNTDFLTLSSAIATFAISIHHAKLIILKNKSNI